MNRLVLYARERVDPVDGPYEIAVTPGAEGYVPPDDVIETKIRQQAQAYIEQVFETCYVRELAASQ